MKRIAGYGILALILGEALVVFFLLGGRWVDLLGLGVIVIVMALFAGGLVITGELWDRGHRLVSVLTAVMLMVVIPSVILQWWIGMWWLVLAVGGMYAGIILAAALAGLMARFALDLIKGDK